ncbi:hypothetical protein NSZ01_36080 [Nocardioides szechwanensis]|uniref:Uncharacterized protein n=1 Tax=Nocardioides szechwanensis TaxID=1005944 RepID=A0A1G9ZXR6_9ACTN|nr:hypothetical protein [Nocardioides szechwanensis]GEP35840.1 hypothetical protein NSZ01_36080 [Nocardioides szechwanensis]SDN25463.1 hypothetical protein SAMN05192576_1857 [Nocardioides szechwanensis]
MKFALRRPTDAPEPVDDDAPPPPPTPPRGRPVAAYAAVDGRTLWLAVDAGPGTLGLRDDAGTVVPLRSAVADEQPGYLSARVDLDELFGTAQDTTAYDAVLVTGGGSAKAVWSYPLPAESKVCPRVSADGTHLWDLARRDDGTLQVVRVPQPASVWLRSLRLEGETVTVTTDPVPDAEPELRLADLEGNVVLTRQMTLGDDGLLRATLSLADLPPGDEVWPRVHVGDVPVRRRHNDLAKPQQATLLPMLFGDDPETPMLRFRFAPEGMLGLRIAARVPGRQEAGA